MIINKYTIKISDIKNSLSEKKMESDQNRVVTPLFRPLSYYLSYLLIKVGFSANKTSLLSFFFGALSLILLSIPIKEAQFLAITFLYIWQLLEYCDGNIARILEKASFAGTVIDNLNASSIRTLMPIALGFNTYLSSHTIWAIEYPAEYNLVMGFVTALLLLFCSYYGMITNILIEKYSSNKKIEKDTENYTNTMNTFIKEKKSYLYLLKMYKIAKYIDSYGQVGLILIFVLVALDFHLYLLLILFLLRGILFSGSLSKLIFTSVQLSR